MATATTPKSQTGEIFKSPDMMGIPDKPTPRRTIVSTYLSAIQSKTAPNGVSCPVIRATEPSTRSRIAEQNKKRLPMKYEWKI